MNCEGHKFKVKGMTTKPVRALVLLILLLLVPLSSCGSPSWKRDPDVQATKADCRDPAEGDRYACIERHAVDSLNPEVCRLVGIWIDDMCLQAVYEAAGDPAICEQIYLLGVRPTCRAYYAGFGTPTPDPAAPRSSPSQPEVELPTGRAMAESPKQLLPPFRGTWSRYSDSSLGFAVEYPSDWSVDAYANQVDALGRSWTGVGFQSDLHGYGDQAFDRYGIGVQVRESSGRTLTETVEYGLSPIVPEVRELIKRRCCLTVGDEPAMELLYGWPMARWGRREVVVLHEGREYRLSFFPQQTLDGNTPADAAARAAFDAFLHTFAFIGAKGSTRR